MANEPEEAPKAPAERDYTALWYVLFFTGFFASLWLIAAFGLIG